MRKEPAERAGLFATQGGVAETLAVIPFGVVVGIEGFLNLERHRQEEAGWEMGLNVLGVNGDNHGSHLFGYSSSSVLVKLPGRPYLNHFRVEDGLPEEGKQLVIVVGEEVNGDGVNCHLYTGWRQGDW